jgi:hypothetical protein
MMDGASLLTQLTHIEGRGAVEMVTSTLSTAEHRESGDTDASAQVY